MTVTGLACTSDSITAFPSPGSPLWPGPHFAVSQQGAASTSGRLLSLLRGRKGASSHSRRAAFDPKRTLENNRLRECDTHSVGAGLPAKQAPRWMAPAVPVFAGEPAPTKSAVRRNVGYGSVAAIRERLPSTHCGRPSETAFGSYPSFRRGRKGLKQTVGNTRAVSEVLRLHVES